MAMNRTLASGVAVVVAGMLVGACSVFGGKAAEEPKYRIVLVDGDIEVRAYEPYAVAWTTAQGPCDEAVRTGFRRLFEYITGANESASNIEMTAPVLTEPESLEAGAIVGAPQRGEDSDAPTILAGTDIDGWSIGFVLPAGYTAATAPAPTGSDVVVSDVAARCVASIRFTGKLGDEAGEAERQALAGWIGARGLRHAGRLADGRLQSPVDDSDAPPQRGAGYPVVLSLIELSLIVDPGKSYLGAPPNKQRCISIRHRRTKRREGAISVAPFNLETPTLTAVSFEGSHSVSATLPGTCDPQTIQEITPMASEPSSPRIDEATLTKGQRRKLNALRKSVGDAIGEQAFVEWLAAQSSSKDSNDENAALIVDTLWPLVQQDKLAIPRGGYHIRRGRGRIIVERTKA